MRRTILSSLLFPALFALVVSSATAGFPADPAALTQAIHTARLDPGRAVEVKDLTIKIGMALFEVDRGIFFPATPVGDRTVEMVFKGQARLALEPPDDVEAGQLELYTGSPELEERISEAALVIAMDAPVNVLYARPPATDVDPAWWSRAEEIFSRWQERPERRLLAVETAILGDALGDPFYASYFAGWFRGEQLGEFLYLFEPEAREQITLGQFVTLDATAKQKRKLERQLDRAQRKGRLIGLSVEDLGQWDTWLSASLPDQEGNPRPGNRAFEPERYVLDLSLADSKLKLHGRARLHLRALSSLGRMVRLEVHPDLAIDRARTGDGRELFFHQSLGDVLVALPEAPEKGTTIVVELEYSGHLIDKVDSGTWVLRSPTHWYPHAGTLDLATYEVTFHWPEKLELVAGGRRVDGGVEDGGRRFERRRLEHPTFGFSFEVGKFRTLTGAAGHVNVTLAFDSLAQSLLNKKSREELLAAVTDSVVYFEEIFGPYPLDELVVVTARREYSQSFLGFVTLSALNISDVNLLTILLGLEDRRTIVAHEIAHQWWGHMVAWQSYRDQWISEAMANYAAVLYARHRLKGEEDPLLIGPTTGWQSALTSITADGRPVESLGPLVLGERLASSRSEDAYQAIVYQKGAVVLDMLARFFGEEDFLKMLRRLAEAVSFRPITTPLFVDLLARLSGQSLDGFAQQFIYGTGLPEIYYTYEFAEKAGKWLVDGVARQESPYRYHYRVVERPDGTLDVTGERRDQIEVADSVLMVPVEIAVYNPQGKTRKQQQGLDPRVAGNLMITTHMLLRGESSELRFELDYEPKELWLDRKREVFGRFFNEHRHPKRMLFYQGLDLAAAGRRDEAEAVFRKALAAEAFSGPAYAFSASDRALKADSRELDARIHLHLTRLYLDAGRTADARAAFGKIRKLLTNAIRYRIGGQLKTLEARLAIRAGEHERAYKLLSKTFRRRGGLASTEGLLLLAIAARETGRRDDFQAAVESASEKGADVSLLSP